MIISECLGAAVFFFFYVRKLHFYSINSSMIVLLALVQFEAAAVNISTSTSLANILVWGKRKKNSDIARSEKGGCRK